MLLMPELTTERLTIRPFVATDLQVAHQLFDVELADAETGSDGAMTLERRRRWLEWSVLNYQELGWLYQPPFGDRAVVLRESGELIGSCGLVPALGPFAQLPTLRGDSDEAATRRFTLEMGLYYAIAPGRRRRGYAAEAAQALIDYGFAELNLRRIVATTSYDNQGSISVMQRLGMRVERNPDSDPPWFQIVGILEQ